MGSIEDTRAKMTAFPNEIFGMFIESLGQDRSSLQACSLVSSLFRHFCGPILYRNVILDSEEKVEAFIQLGGCSNSLRHAQSFSLTYDGYEAKAHLYNPRVILDTISQKAPLETLSLRQVLFRREPLMAPSFPKFSDVTTLVLQECHFGGFEYLVSFIQCFPRCETLCLRGCSWIQNGEDAKQKFGGSPTYELAPTHLEITDTIFEEWGQQFYDQGGVVGMAWLDLTCLKSFTYVIGSEEASGAVLEHIATCEFLEEIDVGFFNPGGRGTAVAQLAPIIARAKSLTLRYFAGHLPWWLPSHHDLAFPPSRSLERIRVVTPGPISGIMESWRLLDDTFSDTNRYPSLKDFGVYSFPATRIGKEGQDMYEPFCMDEYLPCLKEMGRLPP